MTDFAASLIDKPVLSLVGPTAIGKTELSLNLCKEFNCEIISVDSMQVHRYMDIGTAKASLEERRLVPHHLVDIVNPDEDYNAARFVDDCCEAIVVIHERGAIPLLTGGTGLYFRALRDGLFPAPPTDKTIRNNLVRRLAEEGSSALHDELKMADSSSAGRIHPNDSSRIIRALEVYYNTGLPLSDHLRRQKSEAPTSRLLNIISMGLTCERDALYQRINRRTEQLFEMGLEEEVRGLIKKGYGPELKSMQSIGYRHMINYLEGRWSMAECKELLARDTRRYAKRQYTWFGRDESIRWFDRSEAREVFSYVEQNLSSHIVS